MLNETELPLALPLAVSPGTDDEEGYLFVVDKNGLVLLETLAETGAERHRTDALVALANRTASAEARVGKLREALQSLVDSEQWFDDGTSGKINAARAILAETAPEEPHGYAVGGGVMYRAMPTQPMPEITAVMTDKLDDEGNPTAMLVVSPEGIDQ